ncbi:hypothetical protein [Bosea sp. CS1GBMeth4]|uniref:hypothetical protein n=1 Tax=Bosea sp. CS1GBMeth4 TaxID=1892849 RepID=UPI001645D91C|nr:hypothetical protein [Bosea sp. CS1GBMeth4]
MSRRSHRYAALLAAADPGAPSPPRSGGFGCRACGSPAVHLPSDLSAEALVVCDGCQRPVATLADFRAYVSRLAASAQFCDHHLTVCHSSVGTGPDQTG